MKVFPWLVIVGVEGTKTQFKWIMNIYGLGFGNGYLCVIHRRRKRSTSVRTNLLYFFPIAVAVRLGYRGTHLSILILIFVLTRTGSIQFTRNSSILGKKTTGFSFLHTSGKYFCYFEVEPHNYIQRCTIAMISNSNCVDDNYNDPKIICNQFSRQKPIQVCRLYVILYVCDEKSWKKPVNL